MSDEQEELVSGTVEMSIKNVSIKLELSVPAAEVKPQRMLPILQSITNEFVDYSVDLIESENKKVSCKAGCGACCRQLVPISKIEAHNLRELISELPKEKQKEIFERFEDACAKLESIKWMEKFGSGDDLNNFKLRELGLSYFEAKIPCPFLEDESCSIHQNRPLACREYLVTSPAENCSAPNAKNIDMVEMLLKFSNEVFKLSSELMDDQKPGFIPLIKLFEWTDENPEEFPRHSGSDWMGTILTKMANKTSEDREA